jgi:hypothetical protein
LFASEYTHANAMPTFIFATQLTVIQGLNVPISTPSGTVGGRFERPWVTENRRDVTTFDPAALLPV